MINKQYFRMWVEDRRRKLQRQMANNEFTSTREMYEVKGQIKLLKEIYDNHNLEKVDNTDVKVHSDF